MTLLLTFDWPPTTAVLHSSCGQSFSTGASKKTPWPLDHTHDRIILPTNFTSHWMLVDIDLKTQIIGFYDSLEETEEKRGRVKDIVEQRLNHAMGNQLKNLRIVNEITLLFQPSMVSC